MTPEGFHHLTRLLMNLANGKVVIVLEVTMNAALKKSKKNCSNRCLIEFSG